MKDQILSNIGKYRSEKTDRERAIEWWNCLNDQTKLNLIGVTKFWETLTGREIEQIWRKQTEQLCKK